MSRTFRKIVCFFLSVIPLPPVSVNKIVGDDITVTVSDDDAPPRKISSLLSLLFFMFFSYMLFYASFILLPSIINAGSNKQGQSVVDIERKKNPYFINSSDAVYGAPFSFDWNMSIREVSSVSFLSKKPLVCNGLDNGVGGKVQCYFKNISNEDLDRSQFFSNEQVSQTRDILLGSDLTMYFEGNKLVSIGYKKKYNGDEKASLSFYDDSAKIKVLLADAYEQSPSKNIFTSKNSHHFVTLEIDNDTHTIGINYIMYDSYIK